MVLSNKEKSLLLSYSNITGIDEVGRGSVAGPVVVASYTISKQNQIISGVEDSKKLTPSKRETIYQDLIDNAKDYHIIQISNTIIDSKGIVYAISQGISKCIKNTKTDFILIDGIFKEEFKFGTPYQTVIKGDAIHYCIAAASIIAKVWRDKLMEKLSIQYPGYDLENNKGYGTAKHIQGIKSLGLSKIHRREFVNTLLKNK